MEVTAMGVKQYVAVLQKANGGRFMVFATGDQKYYLFAQLYPGTLTATGLSFPVCKASLRRNIRSALAHGRGNI